MLADASTGGTSSSYAACHDAGWSSPTGGAYVFSLFGTCSRTHMAMLLTSVDVLRASAPRHPIVAMLSPNCATEETRALLMSQSITPLCVPRINLASVRCEDQSRQRKGYFVEHFTKLNLFGLRGLDSAFYLDSDAVVLKNVDSVLDRMLANPAIREARTPQGCMEAYAGRRWLNTGVWGVKPNATLLKGLLAWLGTGQSKCFDGDQSAAERYLMLNGAARRRLDDFLLLHVGYNMKANQVPEQCLGRQKLKASDLHVVHFSGTQKPYQLYAYSKTSPRRSIFSREKMHGRGQSRQYYATILYDPLVDHALQLWMTSWNRWNATLHVETTTIPR